MSDNSLPQAIGATHDDRWGHTWYIPPRSCDGTPKCEGKQTASSTGNIKYNGEFKYPENLYTIPITNRYKCTSTCGWNWEKARYNQYYCIKCQVDFNKLKNLPENDPNRWTLKDDVECCLGINGKEQRDCNPDYPPGSSNCISKIQDYCKNDSEASITICNEILKNKDLNSWKIIMEEKCKGEDLKSDICKDYCSNHSPNFCSSELQNFCKDKYPTDDNEYSEYKDICACFYPNNFYTTFYDNLAESLNIDKALLQTEPECLYPDCKSASIKRNTECPEVNIAQCIQTVNFDNQGHIIGDVTFESAECYNTFCKGVNCSSDSNSNINIDDDDDDDDDNDNDIDNNDDDDNDNTFTIIIIIAIILCLLCSSSIGGYLMFNKSD
jgi:hypothetical protein